MNLESKVILSSFLVASTVLLCPSRTLAYDSRELGIGHGYGMTTDGTNIYVTGDNLDFNTLDHGLYTAKLDSSLTVQAASYAYSTESSPQGRGIAIDSHGNIYTAGSFEFVLNNTVHTPDVLVKYSPSLVLLSSVTIPDADLLQFVLGSGGNGPQYLDIASDPQDNIYFTGSMNDKTGIQKLMIAKYDTSLNRVAASTMAIGGLGLTDASGFRITLDGLGNVYLTGTVGGSELVAVKYNSSLVLQSSAVVSGVLAGYGITTDSSSHIYMTGIREVALNVDDLWVGKFDASLVLLSSATVRGDAVFFTTNAGFGITSDPLGSLYVTGFLTMKDPIVSEKQHIWIGKFNSSLVLQSSVTIPNPNIFAADASGYSIRRDNSGAVYVGGANNDRFWVGKFSQPVVPAMAGSASLSTGTINWSWTNSSTVDAYRVYSDSGVALSPLLPAGTTTWAEKGLELNTSYSRYLQAENLLGISSSSLATAFSPSNPPSSATISGVFQSSITLSWPDNGNPPGTLYRAEASSDAVSYSEFYSGITTSTFLSGFLPNRTYFFRVRSENNGGIASLYGQVVSTVTLANPPLASQVFNVGINSANLSWSANGNPPGTAYHAERSLDNVRFGEFYANTLTTATVLALTANATQYFRVRAESSNHVLTAYDITVSTKTLSLLPSPPDGLNVSTMTTTSVTWSWTDNAADELGVRVLRVSDNANLSGDLPAHTTFWEQTGLTPNTSSQVFVQVFNSSGTATSFGSFPQYTLANPPAQSAVTKRTISSVDLAWSPNGNSAGTNYTVARSTDGIHFLDSIKTVPTAVTALFLNAETTYYFRVRAQNNVLIETVPDVVISTRTLPPFPIAPGLVQAAAVTDSSIQWTWIDTAGSTSLYRVLRSSDGVNLSGDLPAQTTAWVQTGLLPNSRQAVSVQVFNESGAASSPASSVYTLADPPSGTILSDVFISSMTISWLSGANPSSTAYAVERSLDGVAFVQWAVGVSPVSVQGLSGGTLYYFRVRAINGDNLSSAYDTVVSTVTQALFAGAPDQVQGSAQGPTSVLWSWSNNVSNATGVRVRNPASGGILSGNLPAGTTFWLQTGLAVNAPAQALVEVFNALGSTRSIPSAVLYTQANGPLGTDLSNVTMSSATLSWLGNGNPIGTLYHVERSANQGPFAPFSSGPEVSVAFADLSASTAYSFRVRAENHDGLLTSYDAVVSTVTPAPPAPVPVLLLPISELLPAFHIPDRVLGSGDVIAVEVPAGYLIKLFHWNVTPRTGVSSNAAPALRASGSVGSPSEFTTTAGRLPLSNLLLAPGAYRLSVQAEDQNGFFSQAATANFDLAPDSFSAFKVSPNPWRKDLNGGDPKIVFQNLPSDCTIKIFTLSGHWVRTLKASGSSEAWGLDNDAGSRVASGIYFFVLEDGQGARRRGTLGIIK